MRTIFKKLPTATRRERIVQEVREAILTRELLEGERLVERDLAAQFATSLTSVREALIQLETEGFVIKKPNSTTHVVKLSLEDEEKIYAIRKVLETFAVEEAARLTTPEQFRELEAVYLEMLEAARSNRLQEFILDDLRVHEKIWDLAGNEYLAVALRRVTLPLFTFSAIRILAHDSFDLLQDAQSHLPILECIKRNDPECARRACLDALEEWHTKSRAYVFGTTKS